MTPPCTRSVARRAGSLLLCAALAWSQGGAAAPGDAEARIDALIGVMSLEEKVGQTALRGVSSRHRGPLPEALFAEVRAGRAGAMLNVMDEAAAELQRIAVEESPRGIPLLYARDVIHGFRTVFPLPLAQAASWNAEHVRKAARVAAREASSRGIRWTFAPMIDIARDPRWGRIAESFGEDPLLTAVLGAAMIDGFQQEDIGRPDSLAATAKHYAGYGAAEGGRDYNTTTVDVATLHDIYLKPFAAAVDAGVATLMTGFNDLNGVPATANPWLLEEVLRRTWRFDGFVVSDWESLTETIAHGFAQDARHAARLAANAGLDMEMVSTAWQEYLGELIAEGEVTEARLDDAVRRILRLKLRLGLFEEPYFDPGAHEMLRPEDLEFATRFAADSMVLLKNEDVLPLDEHARILVTGPLTDAPREQLGTWSFDGSAEDSVTPLAALRERFGARMLHVPTLSYSRDTNTESFDEAVAAAELADAVVVFAGEEAILSGEAHSRADLRLPGAQETLITRLASAGAPVVVVLMSGRPNTLEAVEPLADALLVAWHGGTMAGPALAAVLTGDISPQGRLPVSWPRTVGQVPIHYNHKSTGRPPDAQTFVHIDDIPVGAWQSSLSNRSHYLDAGFEPMYPFGFGLSYSSVEYRNLRQSATALDPSGTLSVSADIVNSSDRSHVETVQLYVHDRVGSITRPVRELKDFRQVAVAPGASVTVTFEIGTGHLRFHDAAGASVLEPGGFDFWIAPNAATGLAGRFELLSAQAASPEQ